MAEKKDNRVTRFHDEIIMEMNDRITTIRNQARGKAEEAFMLNSQADILSDQIDVITGLLNKGAYENGKTE